MANINAFILNKHYQLQPIGVPGELCLAGAGLARGYLNNAELTKASFIEHPFDPGKKLYKTGDLARLRADGNIEYLGRMDRQIKIRGFRIELDEIRYHLLQDRVHSGCGCRSANGSTSATLSMRLLPFGEGVDGWSIT